MYPDSYYVNTRTGELMRISNPEQSEKFSVRMYTEPNWERISSSEYAIYCQVAIWAVKKSIS